ncbi:MAG: caspase family protein [Dehalococcoidia bacterium]|nr:caspase family protein [Dehalococcoidia bacterium]
MKKFLAILLALSLLMALLLPSVSYAKPGGQHDQHDGDDDVERYAIIIGISDYPGDLNVLQGGLDVFYSDDDAYAVRKALIISGFKPKNITVLVNKKATYSSILSEIAELDEKVDEGDEVLFFFSGHVVADENPSAAGALLVWGDDLNELEPRMLMDDVLKTAFDDFETDNIVFIFDSCYAARFSELAGDGRVLIGATGPDGISGEYGPAYAALGAVPLPGIGWMEQGLFTYFFFVQGIIRKWADANLDRTVTYAEAFQYAKPILEYWTLANQGSGLDEIPVWID